MPGKEESMQIKLIVDQIKKEIDLFKTILYIEANESQFEEKSEVPSQNLKNLNSSSQFLNKSGHQNAQNSEGIS